MRHSVWRVSWRLGNSVLSPLFYGHRVWDLVWFKGSTSVILLVSKADLNLGFWFIILPHVSKVQSKVCGFPGVTIALQVWVLGKAVFLLSETPWVWTTEVDAVIRPHWSRYLGEEKERSRLSTPIWLSNVQHPEYFLSTHPLLCSSELGSIQELLCCCFHLISYPAEGGHLLNSHYTQLQYICTRRVFSTSLPLIWAFFRFVVWLTLCQT